VAVVVAVHLAVLPLTLLAKLIAEYVPVETPVILLPGAMAQQRGALGL